MTIACVRSETNVPLCGSDIGEVVVVGQQPAKLDLRSHNLFLKDSKKILLSKTYETNVSLDHGSLR